MKYKHKEMKSIVFVMTYGSQSTRSPLEDTGPPKGQPSLKFKKNSAPGKYTT